MKVLFSGIQPTGQLHLGNYLGAIKNWVKLQNYYQSFFCIVDYHAITVSYSPKQMQERILETAIDLLAYGIDPKKACIFVQSRVPEHTELAWILNTLTPISELKRMTQFKEKLQKQPQSVNLGLFAYPILQAADILLYKANFVPVGQDQLQHIELSRTIARRFNAKFSKTFPEPKALLTEAGKIMSLTDPSKKMSKTDREESYIALTDKPEKVWKKLSTAVTDLARKRKTDPGRPEKCNLFSLHQFFSDRKEIGQISAGCRQANIGCLDCKKILAKNLSQELASIQFRREKIANQKEEVEKILNQGANFARKIAQKNLAEVKKKMGIL